VYSLPETVTVYSHPNIGQMTISDETNGGGRVSITWSGDMSSHQATANGYTVITKLHIVNGVIGLEVPQNSPADKWLRKACAYLDTTVPANFALSTITIQDHASGMIWNASGVTPQKKPDRQYDQNGGMVSYTFLCAKIVESGPKSEGW
jgi:hypothetical protein